jgi:hypothetical protein
MDWSDPMVRTRPLRAPSGLFPSRPTRPTYREPHPVRGGSVAAGLGVGALWMLLFGLLGSASIRAYGWWTILAGVVGWALAVVLARYGDRGVAVGAAIVVGCGWAVAGVVLAFAWAATGWPLW